MPPKKFLPKKSPSLTRKDTAVILAELNMRLSRLEDRLDRREAKAAVEECLDPAVGVINVSDLRGRPVWWVTNGRASLRITDMSDSHLESAIAYLRRGAGPLTVTQRSLYLEALAYEQGRRYVCGKKG